MTIMLFLIIIMRLFNSLMLSLRVSKRHDKQNMIVGKISYKLRKIYIKDVRMLLLNMRKPLILSRKFVMHGKILREKLRTRASRR